MEHNGHSISRWEGDTLVVETVGLRADTVLHNTGLPKSGGMKVIERIRLIGSDKLENEITMIDPPAFTRPLSVDPHMDAVEGRGDQGSSRWRPSPPVPRSRPNIPSQCSTRSRR